LVRLVSNACHCWKLAFRVLTRKVLVIGGDDTGERAGSGTLAGWLSR
jgi:hypothetical protein